MSQMQQYHDLVANVINNGRKQINARTGSLCKVISGCMMTFDVSKEAAVLTTRKTPFKSTRGELLGFFRGYDNAEQFRSLGCLFWDKNANETEGWLENPYRLGVDDLGRIYSKQWTDWLTYRFTAIEGEIEYLINDGWEYLGKTDHEHPEGSGLSIFRKSINQLEKVVRTLLTDPSDRRIIVSGWNPGELDLQALPACHMDYRFIAYPDSKELDVVMTMRSMDLYLGTPANILSTNMFLAIVARLTGYNPGKVIVQGANVHLYDNSIQASRELLTRDHFEAPHIVLSDKIKKIVHAHEIEGCFERINPEDIELIGYEYHMTDTKVEMVA